jgi:flagellar motor switch protein FliG
MYGVKGMDNLFITTFNKLDIKLQVKILIEIYRTGTISHETIKEISTESGQKLLKELHMASVKLLLNNVGRLVEKNIVETLEKLDGDFAEEIKNSLFTFENIIMLPDNAIKKWVEECNEEDLIIGLSQTKRNIANRIISNMSDESAEKIEKGIKDLKELTLDNLYIAKTNLISILRRMDISGEVSIGI